MIGYPVGTLLQSLGPAGGAAPDAPAIIVANLYLSAIQTAIHEHLSACAELVALVPGGIHDTMAPPAPHEGTEVYPYIIGTLITTTDISPFCESIQWILYQTDIYHDSTSTATIGEVSRRLQECLDRNLVVEAYGHYYSFNLHATVARRLKEAPGVWRIGSDFEGLVHRIQP